MKTNYRNYLVAFYFPKSILNLLIFTFSLRTYGYLEKRPKSISSRSSNYFEFSIDKPKKSLLNSIFMVGIPKL
ncbi:MAG: hypothetical protein P8Y97_03335, partial [Candidatus Lokiarchaeota archaeon]